MKNCAAARVTPILYPLTIFNKLKHFIWEAVYIASVKSMDTNIVDVGLLLTGNPRRHALIHFENCYILW